jgi:hypothetical protein
MTIFNCLLYYKASYVPEINKKPLQKSSKSREECEKWLEEMKIKFPRA